MANWTDDLMAAVMADWDWKRWVVFLVPIALLGLGVAGWFLFKGAIRTRREYNKRLVDDQSITEFLVIFNWSRKILYIPTILAALVASLLMLLTEKGVLTIDPHLVGGSWLLVFFLNFLIDEYEVSFQVVLTVILLLLALGLWLTFLDWLKPFMDFIGRLGIVIDSLGYLLFALVFSFAVAISWVRGMFYYAAITPNFINIQNGPSENGEQISREEYNTKIDTGDFLERLLGFGRIIVIFSDTRRHPLSFLVWGIHTKSQKLEAVRAKLEVDAISSRLQAPPPAPPPTA